MPEGGAEVLSALLRIDCAGQADRDLPGAAVFQAPYPNGVTLYADILPGIHAAAIPRSSPALSGAKAARHLFFRPPKPPAEQAGHMRVYAAAPHTLYSSDYGRGRSVSSNIAFPKT